MWIGCRYCRPAAQSICGLRVCIPALDESRVPRVRTLVCSLLSNKKPAARDYDDNFDDDVYISLCYGTRTTRVCGVNTHLTTTPSASGKTRPTNTTRTTTNALRVDGADGADGDCAYVRDDGDDGAGVTSLTNVLSAAAAVVRLLLLLLLSAPIGLHSNRKPLALSPTNTHTNSEKKTRTDGRQTNTHTHALSTRYMLA